MAKVKSKSSTLDWILPNEPLKLVAALVYGQVPAFTARLRDELGMAELALRFAILTAARMSKVIGATRDEIDMEGRVWIVPADRMKGGREHRVLPTDAAIEVLRSPAGNRLSRTRRQDWSAAFHHRDAQLITQNELHRGNARPSILPLRLARG